MFPEMGDDVGGKAHKDEHGYTCPLCGRAGLSGSEMAAAWSAADWSYVAIWCLECQSDTNLRHRRAAEAGAEPPTV